MNDLEASRKLDLRLELHPPTPEELAPILRTELRAFFRDLSVDVVPCPGECGGV